MVAQIGARDLAVRLENGHPLVLLDVRQPWEHEIAALPGSLLVPLSELNTRADEVKAAAAEEKLVVVYCHHGLRSQSGAALLQRLGCAPVASLAGGIDAWSCEVDPAVPRY